MGLCSGEPGFCIIEPLYASLPSPKPLASSEHEEPAKQHADKASKLPT